MPYGVGVRVPLSALFEPFRRLFFVARAGAKENGMMNCSSQLPDRGFRAGGGHPPLPPDTAFQRRDGLFHPASGHGFPFRPASGRRFFNGVADCFILLSDWGFRSSRGHSIPAPGQRLFNGGVDEFRPAFRTRFHGGRDHSIRLRTERLRRRKPICPPSGKGGACILVRKLSAEGKNRKL